MRNATKDGKAETPIAALLSAKNSAGTYKCTGLPNGGQGTHELAPKRVCLQPGYEVP